MTASGLGQILKRRSKLAGVSVTAHSFMRSLAIRWLSSKPSEVLLMSLTGWRSQQMITRDTSTVAEAEAIRQQHEFLADENSSQNRRGRLRAV